MSKNVLLEMKHIHKRFAGVHALNDISLSSEGFILRMRETYGLMGKK